MPRFDEGMDVPMEKVALESTPYLSAAEGIAEDAAKSREAFVMDLHERLNGAKARRDQIVAQRQAMVANLERAEALLNDEIRATGRALDEFEPQTKQAPAGTYAG